MPALDPAPVHLRIRDSDGADRAVLHQPPHLLLRLAQERDRRARESEPAVCRKVDERPCARVVAGERLLTMYVLAGFESCARDLGMDGRVGQVDDRVDGGSPRTSSSDG